MDSARDILEKRLDGEEIPAEVVSLALKEAEQIIKNYCARESVPWQLNFTWANMAHDIITVRYLNKRADGIPDSEAASIRAGDVTVTRSAELVAHRINVDQLTRTYAPELNSYRRFRWGL